MTQNVDLEASFERVSLPLDRPFTISRGTTETTENVIVRIDDGERTGVGAAAPDPYYGETPATVESVLPRLFDALETVGDPLNRAAITRAMNDHVRGNAAAKAAVSIAVHDLVGKRLDLPLYRLFGLDPSRSITSSFTVGLDDPQTMADNAREAVDAGYTVLKTKLGTDHDPEIIEAVRNAAPEARIRVDANEAWTPREAVEMSKTLAHHNIEFLEQPVAATDRDGLRFVYEHARLPIAVDESCVTPADVPNVADRSDIVVVKLMKCGGPRQARKLIHAARAHDLEIMLGCMVETNAAIAGACHLTPLVDYADLDGALLLAEDRYSGIDLSAGTIDLSTVNRPGTGVEPI
ncbi:dipeptide epimerase [Halocatena pleomorpha]|uniref:Dipeptide epimerase n=1 Tax=Halocatena pleomorpha TaxID=1785090 RepID=A0A3P3RLF9_9EURY|nr:dipeptide epimerase [Halocatena pleomorpha]RRJ33728.1 dipeptide epimerase [Halocatena pleomorpha]